MKEITQFMEFAKKEKGYSDHTLTSYAYDLNRFDGFMIEYINDPKWSVRKVDRQSIRHFLGKEFEEGYGSRTVARRLATVKSFFNFLHRSGEINVNPASDVRTPKTPKKLPVYIDVHTIKQLMNAPLENTKTGLRDRAVLEIFYSTGMRLSELVNLDLGHFNSEQQLVRVLGKGNKERLIPFGQKAKEALKKYLKKRGISLKTGDLNEPCFVNSKGGRISMRTIQRRVNMYLKQVAEGASLGPHILRPSFATHMLERGADIRALKDLLGHSSLSSTQVYTHIQPEKMKKIYKQSHPHGE